MSKTLFTDGDSSLGILGTIVRALFLNKIFSHRHDGADEDGSAPINYAADTGAADAYVIALTPALSAHVVGMPITFKVSNANTGASTININGLGAVALKKNVSQDPASGEIAAGQLLTISYDGTNYQIIAGLIPAPVLSPGMEMLWPTETPPAGWLEENGAAISRTTYAALFAVIGTMYGAGNGSSTFNLPDARGKFVRIWNHAAGVDPDAAARTDRGDGTTGDHVGTNQAEALKTHTHTIPSYGVAQNGGDVTIYQVVPGGTISSGSTGDNETRPVNTYRMLVMKY
jgi:microcystin-dependent protein